MIDGIGLVHRLARAAPDAGRLQGLRTRIEAMARRPNASPIQPALFDEYTAVLAGAAEDAPVVVVIDDLQWADAGSMALLWHLVRRLDRLRVLLVGAYRPEEVSSRTADSDALESLLRELSVQADLTIELSADHRFVDALIDAEPNQLDAEFRSRLFAFTGGHPLFTVELLRGMQERSQIARDPAGVWVAQESLSWDEMPQRLEAAIERRVAPLPSALRADLTASSVQGEQFVAEVAAAVRVDPDTSTRLHEHARSAGRVIEPIGVDRIDDRLMTRYRFRHGLFQHYLYGTLDDAEHVKLHEATARALQELCANHPDPPVVDLAYHFDQARLMEPSIDYLEQAAYRARRMAANDEAIRLLERAHELIQMLPASPERDEREVELLVLLAAPMNVAQGWGTPEAQRISDRLRQLSDQVKPSIATALALIRLAGTHQVAGRFDLAAPWSNAALIMADAIDNPTLRSVAASDHGQCLLELGELEAAHQLLATAYGLDNDSDPHVINAYGADPVPQALAFDGLDMLALGYPDQARALTERAIESARTWDHAFTRCLVLDLGIPVREAHGDHEAAVEALEELEQILAKQHFPFWEARALGWRGILTDGPEHLETGIELLQRALAQLRTMAVTGWNWPLVVRLAELEHRRGDVDRALRVIAGGEHETDPKGAPRGALALSVERSRLLRLKGDEAAHGGLLAALATADSMGERWRALEAAKELALIYEAEGRRNAAVDVLAPRYEWFVEGLGTPLLSAAREVLGRL